MFLRGDFEEIFFAWTLFDSKGLLPHAGTWSEQSAELIQAFKTISAAVGAVYEEIRIKAQQQTED